MTIIQRKIFLELDSIETKGRPSGWASTEFLELMELAHLIRCTGTHRYELTDWGKNALNLYLWIGRAA